MCIQAIFNTDKLQVHLKLTTLCMLCSTIRFYKIYHTVGTVLKWNIKIEERGKIDTSNTQIHDL